MYYDTRPVIFTKYNSANNSYYNYGHISDNTPNPGTTVSGKNWSTSVYWNYGWVPKGYKVCAKDMVINVDATPSITFTIGCVSVTITPTQLTLSLRTSLFNKVTSRSYTLPEDENIFDQEEFEFFVGYEDVELINNKIYLRYFVKINDVYYRDIASTARDGFTNHMVFDFGTDPFINTDSQTSSTVNFAISPVNVSFRVITLIVLGSSLFGDECVLPEGVRDEDLDISDFYDQQIVLLHSHVNGGIHNHTRRATTSSNVSRNYSGESNITSPKTRFVIQYSKNAPETTCRTLYIVSSLDRLRTAPPYKIQLGGNDFVISFYGYLNSSTDSDAIHKVPFRLYFGEFVGKAIGDKDGKYIPEGSTTATEAKSTLKMNLLLDKGNNRLQANIYGDSGTKNISESNLKWHPLFQDRFQLTLYYDHGAKQLKIYSSLISKSVISEDTLDNRRYLLHTENNVAFNTLSDAFFQFGPNPSELLDVSYTASSFTALDKYAFALTDIVSVGFSPTIVNGKIYYCTTSLINSQISDSYRIKSGTVYDLWIIGNDTERKSESTGLVTNIMNHATPLGVTHVGDELLNGFWCTHYTLNPVEFGAFVVTSSYSNITSGNPYRYECHVDLTINVIIVPTFEISGQGSSNSSLQDIGSSSRPKFSVKSEDDFNLIVETNYDLMPTLVNTSELDIRAGTRISVRRYAFLVKPFEVGTFNFTIKYDASDSNEAKSITVSVQVLPNKKNTEISLKTKTNTELKSMTLTSGASQDFVIITNRSRSPDIEVSQRRAISTTYKSTEPISGTSNYKHTYSLNGQFPGQNIMVLCTYDDDGIYTGNSASFLVTVESAPLDPWVDPGSASIVIVQKDSTGEWRHALSMNSAGTVISKTDIKVSTEVKNALKSFANNLKT